MYDRILISQNKIQNSSDNIFKESNKISTTMYKYYNFFYLGLFIQLKQYSNIYFILIAILALIKEISTLDPFSAFAPVVFVIFFSLAFDWGVDLKRYFTDRITNNAGVRVIRNGELKNIKAKDVKVGDLLLLKENELVMADILLLGYKNTKNYSFIDTSSLDGEKTLKPKMSVFDKNEIAEFIDGGFLEKISLKDSVLNKEFQTQQIEELGKHKSQVIKSDPNLVNVKSSFLTQSKIENIMFPEISLTYKKNIASLDFFEGEIKYKKVNEPEKTLNLDINFFIPRTSKIRNTWDVIGLVVYVGKNTKVMKNTQKRIFKQTLLEKKMNSYIIIVIIFFAIFLLLLGLVAYLLKRRFFFEKEILKSNEEINFFFIYTILGYLLLNNTFLPISLIITLQLVKVFQNMIFLSNEELKDRDAGKKSVIKTVNLHEEAGQIEYILTDKTGTLTENKMIAQYFQIMDNEIKLEKDSINLNETNLEIKDQEKEFKKFSLFSEDKLESIEFKSQAEIDFFYYLIVNTCHDCFSKDKDFDQPNNQENLLNKNNSKNLVLDKNTVDINSNEFSILKNFIDYEGPSPDEIALLKGCRDFCNILLKGTNKNLVLLLNSQNENMEIEKLFVNKFSSERKMMSVIVRWNKKIILLAKGADTIIYTKCVNEMSEKFKDQINSFLEKGLRILFMAMRVMSEEEYQKFKETVNTAKKEEKTKKEMIEIKSAIEEKMFLFGASAIEDKLQKEVPLTVGLLKEADIKIWMITGDKMETAINVAYLSTLFDKNYPPEIVDEEIFTDQIMRQPSIKKKKWVWRWNKNKNSKKNDFNDNVLQDNVTLNRNPNLSKEKSSKTIELKTLTNLDRNIYTQNNLSPDSKPKKNLLITSEILIQGLSEKHRVRFTRYIMKYDCVVFARTSPNQKVEIARLLKEQKKVVLAVGDGANDVNMIQEANVGVGVIGEEGKQAVNASDFGIPSFRFLKPLILHHGRGNYYRMSLLILLFYFKNFLFTFPQVYYAFFCDFSRMNIYNDWYMNFYNLIFTGFNVSSKGVSELNFDERRCVRRNYLPEVYLYFLGQKNKLFNFKKFFFWLISSIFESFIIFISVKFLTDQNIYFENHETGYITVSVLIFSSIIFYLNFKLFYWTNIIDFYIIFGFVFLPISFFIYVAATNTSERLGYYKSLSYCWNIPNFYLYLVLIVSTLVLVTSSYWIISRKFFPSFEDKLIHFNFNLSDEEQRLELRKMKEDDFKSNFRNFIFR